jgi:hypothetical protein
MNKAIAILFLALTILAIPQTQARRIQEPPTIEIAILLDTSNSMDGLINQAKSQLWTIVQEFVTAKKAGCQATLKVALFEYGNTDLPIQEGFIRQVVPLGNDLDALSEALFALDTNGGDEYCGQVIKAALDRLAWSRGGDAYRAVFIAGNEPFTQGQVDYRESCDQAVDRGIVINTIHCGPHREGVGGKWTAGAQRGRGEALNIDQDRQIVHIPCPQDPFILELNEKINKTYIWFGVKEERDYFATNQSAQDHNARSLSPSVGVKRSITKADKFYNNEGRDLVDSILKESDLLEMIPSEQLPEHMQAMSEQERREYLAEMRKKRQDLQKQINKLAAEREIYLTAEKKRRADAGEEETLGGAVIAAIQKQLAEAGFDTR